MEENRWVLVGDEGLARGCAERDPSAIRAFVERYRGTLREGLEAAARRDSELGVEVEDLGERAARAVSARYADWPSDGGSLPPIDALLGRLRMEDLVLAIACSKGSERGWRVFDDRFGAFIRSSAAHLARSPADVEEIVEGFYADLFLPQTDGGNAISRFQGRSTLRTWLRAVLFFRVRDHYTRSRRTVNLSSIHPEILDGPELGDRPGRRGAGFAPPGERFHSRDLRAAVASALRRALASLSVPDREIVREYYFERRTVVEIGESRGVHKASVSRWLKRLRGRLAREMKRDMGSDFPRTAEEVGQLLRALDEDPSGSPTVGA
jgi:RNA polymerase sigma-70 factor